MARSLSKVALAALGLAAGQQAGTSQTEGGPSVALKECTKAGGCASAQHTAVLDSNWRWVHNVGGYTNCYKGNQWDASFCPDPQTCSKNCALEGVSSDQYVNTYGVVAEEGGLRLNFVTQAQYGTNYGSRLYLLDNAAEVAANASTSASSSAGGRCGYDCGASADCGACTGFAVDGYCAASQSNCEGGCNGKWCEGPAPGPSPGPSPGPAPQPGNKYKIFKLLNREFSFDVDVSKLPCGLNGALYFVEMDPSGSLGGGNQAGAKYGTGYCDAQCPHDIKFINGEANILDWKATTPDTGIGRYGTCCAEMDIWESNKMAEAYTAHPCKAPGQKRCDGLDCGDSDAGHRYDGVCDKDGCDFNPFRMGEKGFFGEGSSFKVDTSKPFTVVTQFITSDGTDSGDLVEIRRFFRQNGQVIPNPKASILGAAGGDSLKDGFCSTQKTTFGDKNDFAAKGGLKSMGEALGRGMVIAMSLWDDNTANMLWLDATYPTDKDPSVPGVARGSCPLGDTNTPAYVRQHFPTASVHYFNIAVGEIGSTGPSLEQLIV